MQTTVEFLDSVKAAHGLTSDYQLSQYLECTRGAISSYRTGRTYLDEDMACKIAADLDLDPGYVLTCIAAERSHKPAAKAAWQHAAKLLGGIAAALAIFAVLSPYPGQFDGSQAHLVSLTKVMSSVYYVKSLLVFYWWLLAPLAILALYHLPAKSRRPS